MSPEYEFRRSKSKAFEEEQQVPPRRSQAIARKTATDGYLIKSYADPSYIIEVTAEQYVKASVIIDCGQIIRGLTQGGSPPWWFQFAIDQLLVIYHSEDLSNAINDVVKNIESLYCYGLSDGRKFGLTHQDKGKIIHAMFWLHQNEVPRYIPTERRKEIRSALNKLKDRVLGEE